MEGYPSIAAYSPVVRGGTDSAAGGRTRTLVPRVNIPILGSSPFQGEVRRGSSSAFRAFQGVVDHLLNALEAAVHHAFSVHEQARCAADLCLLRQLGVVVDLLLH